MTEPWPNGMDRSILDPRPAQLWSKASESFSQVSRELRSAIDTSPNVGLRAYENTVALQALRDIGMSERVIFDHARQPKFADSLQGREKLHEIFQHGVAAVRRAAHELLLPPEVEALNVRFSTLEAEFEESVTAYSRVTQTHVLLQTHQELVAREAGCFWPESGASWPKMEHEFARRMEPVLGARDVAFDELSPENVESYLATVDRFFSTLLAVAPTESETFAALPLHKERTKLADQLEVTVLLHGLENETSPPCDTVDSSDRLRGAVDG